MLRWKSPWKAGVLIWLGIFSLVLINTVTAVAESSVEKAVVQFASADVSAVAPEETILLPIAIQSKSALAGIQLTVSFDEVRMLPEKPELTERSAGMISAQAAKDGEMTVLVYSVEGKQISPGDGPVVNLVFTSKDGSKRAGEVHLKEVILADPEAQIIPSVVRSSTRSCEMNAPTQYRLGQNYPNPFNPRTDIRYQIADGGSPIHTTLKIYNILGQEVRTLVNEMKEPGYYTVTWDGRNDQGIKAVSGVYLYRLEAGNSVCTRSMLVLK